METLLILGTLFATAVILIVAVQSGMSKDQSQALSNIAGFKPAVRYEGALGLPGLALDPESNRFVIMRGANVKVFDFASLIAIEVSQNGGSLSRTHRGSQATGAVVGGLLLGPAGFLVGGLSGKKTTTDLVKRLSLKLFTNDLVQPVHEVLFFNEHQGKPFDSMGVRHAAEQLDQWHGRFRTILAMQERGLAPQRAAIGITPDEPENLTDAPALIDGPAAPRKSWLGRTFGA